MSECVSEGGREGGGGADTELKTKTPHVNVGEKSESVLFFLSGAAISSRLIDLSFCSDSFSACTYIYIYI